jgi:hypothetical protein
MARSNLVLGAGRDWAPDNYRGLGPSRAGIAVTFAAIATTTGAVAESELPGSGGDLGCDHKPCSIAWWMAAVESSRVGLEPRLLHAVSF